VIYVDGGHRGSSLDVVYAKLNGCLLRKFLDTFLRMEVLHFPVRAIHRGISAHENHQNSVFLPTSHLQIFKNCITIVECVAQEENIDFDKFTHYNHPKQVCLVFFLFFFFCFFLFFFFLFLRVGLSVVLIILVVNGAVMGRGRNSKNSSNIPTPKGFLGLRKWENVANQL